MSTRQPQRQNDARARLARMVSEQPSVDLVEASFLVALEEYPRLQIEREAARVRLISAEAARRVYALENPFARLAGLSGYLFEELGFRGNTQEFNDPRNSYLNEVLDRRLGIPLTLSILFIEAARAAAFEARGVALPGHLVTRVTFGGRTLFVDPFDGGRVIAEEDCRQLVTRTTGRPSLFRRELLQGTDDNSLIARMLLNLKHIYVKRKDYARALAAAERLLLFRPGDAAEIRDCGFLKAHLGRPVAAIADLETYLAGSPDAPDTESVRGRVVWLKRRLSESN